MDNISRLMTLSTLHLPPKSAGEVRKSIGSYHNPQDKEGKSDRFFVLAELLSQDKNLAVQQVGNYALSRQCEVIFFDPDADPLPTLPIYDEAFVRLADIALTAFDEGTGDPGAVTKERLAELLLASLMHKALVEGWKWNHMIAEARDLFMAEANIRSASA